MLGARYVRGAAVGAVAVLLAGGLSVAAPVGAWAATGTSETATTVSTSATIILLDPQKRHVHTAGVAITIDGLTEVPLTKETGADGEVTFTDIYPGPYTVTVPNSTTRVGAPFVHIYAHTGHHVYAGIVDPHGATISGTVTDAAGQPVAGALVRANEAGLTTTTNSAGHYALQDLYSGTYTIQFNARPDLNGGPNVHPGVQPIATKASTWSFYGAAPGTSAPGKEITVVQGSAGHAASVVTGVDGVVFHGHTLTASIGAQPGWDFSNADIMFEGANPDSSFSTPVDASTADSATATERLVGGRYKVGFTGWFDNERFWLWYTGPTTAPAFDDSQGAWYTYDGSKDAVIAFTGTAVLPTL